MGIGRVKTNINDTPFVTSKEQLPLEPLIADAIVKGTAGDGVLGIIVPTDSLGQKMLSVKRVHHHRLTVAEDNVAGDVVDAGTLHQSAYSLHKAVLERIPQQVPRRRGCG